MKKFNKEDLEIIIIGILTSIPFLLIFWFIYKVAKSVYHLLDKLIDKL